MEQVMEILTDAGLELLGLLIGAVITWVGYHIQEWLKTDKNAKQLKEKEAYAMLAVEAVELVSRHLTSVEKYNDAKRKLVKWAETYDIPLESHEIDTLIEQSVKRLKDTGREIKQTYVEETEGVTE